MRRLTLVLPLVLAGCGALRDAFSARPEFAARVNDRTLSVAQLGELVGGSRQVPLEAEALNRVASAWVDYTLFAQALAEDEDLRDSTTLLAAWWPLVSQLKWQRYHDRLLAQRGTLTPRQLDSAYQAGDLRLLQHILFRLPPNAGDSADTAKRRQAERLLPQARAAGARFGQLARRHSEDPGSRAQDGRLGVFGRGQFVPEFEDAAWELRPGGVSGVVKTQFGYHIIRRPPLAEVRDSFHAEVTNRALARADSAYRDSLSERREIEVVDRAPDLVRAAVEDLEDARSSGGVLVEYRGGAFRVRDLVRWIESLDPGLAAALPQATDDQIRQFVRAVVQQELLVEEADSAGITLTPDDLARVGAQHDSVLATLGVVLSLTPEVLRDSAATPEARRDLAAARVEQYLERVLQGRARYFPVPPPLAQTLRGRNGAQWGVHPAGLRRALAYARDVRETVDSLQGSAPRPPGLPPTAAPDTAGRSR
ncbi:MAG: peptidylprolyl isomerase [Gemmatimonadales bacterium]